MSRRGRIVAEFGAAWRAFVRRRTALFFTFFFPAILIVIFGALVTTPAAGGLFAEPPVYYVPGYLAVVVLFTPLSRVSSTVARHRAGNRFEKLATTPLSPGEWLFAHVLVNAVLVGVASLLVLALVVLLTGARLVASPLLAAFVAAGVALFCGIGAVLGRIADSQDGAIAASNAIGLPLLFLSETFVPPALLPAWFRPLIGLSPLSYFARGSRLVLTGEPAGASLAITVGLAVVAFALGVSAVPWKR